MSLKVVKFNTKMYLNFSNFRGRTLAGGGQALVQKQGQVSDGGIDKIFTGWGDPPGEKNPVPNGWQNCMSIIWKSLWIPINS